jgi:hypothetical protein
VGSKHAGPGATEFFTRRPLDAVASFLSLAMAALVFQLEIPLCWFDRRDID